MYVEDEGGQEPNRLSETETIDRKVHDMELGLARDDPDFVRRMRRIEARDVANAVAVFLLLALGAVLLVVGLATQTWSTWLAGALAFLFSFAADALYQRGIARM